MAIKAKSWLDKLPAELRHGLILTAGALLTWAGTAVTSLPSPLPEIGGVLISLAVLYYTGITKQYGVGKKV